LIGSGTASALAGAASARAYCADGARPGELNLGFTAEDDRETVAGIAASGRGDQRRPGHAAGDLKQIHSNLVRVAALRTQPRAAPRRRRPDDDEPGLLLGVQTADCIPVLVADRKRRVVAAFHAGWRGTVNRIVESGVGRMRLEFGSRPEDLVAAIGPGIGPAAMPSATRCSPAFESQFAYARELFREVYDADPVRTKYPMLFMTQRAPGHSEIGPSLHLNLVEANRRQLLAAGVKPRQSR
jgi:copper oxidase (laccase) domain-containing protein